MVLGTLPIPGRSTNFWTTVEQGPTALAVGADGVFGHFFLTSIVLTSFSLCLGDGPI